MKKLKFLFFPTVLALAFGLMLSCAKSSSEDSSSSTTTSGTTTTDNTTITTDTSTSSAVTLSGKVQKGPYVQGTEITVRELDSSMIPTGNTFTGTIDDNTGSFGIKGTLTNKMVELSADGYYFNEVSGALSTGKLTLSALSDLTDSSSVNVNLMTHLEKKRVEYLLDNSKLTFSAAKTQVQTEILKIFNIENVTLGNSETLDISKSGDGNAVLLAISAILQSDKTDAELTELLSNINTDIRPDGTLDSTITKAALVTAMEYVKPLQSTIRSNIEARYNALGMSVSIPSFETYLIKLDTIKPTVSSVSPTSNATTVAVNSPVTATFSETMTSSSITTSNFYLKDSSSNTITSSVSYSGLIATLTPSSNLSENSTISATLTTNVTDIAKNALASNYSWSFTTGDFTAPIVAEVTAATPTTSDTTPSYTFSSTEAGTITYGGSCSSPTTTASSGDNTIDFSNLSDGTYNCTIMVTDSSGNAGNTLTATSFTVDTTGPTVTSVSSNTSNGNYKASDNISVTVTFNETVVVDNSSGNPRIQLETGTTDQYATYSSGSSSNVLVFNYTVQSGDNSSDLDYKASNSLSLNSGTIKDSLNNDATLTLPSPSSSGSLGANKAIIIDTTAPTVSSSTPADNTTSEANYTTISLIFSESMDNSTITTNTSNTSCSGSFQVSSDNFTFCIQMVNPLSVSNSNKTFIVTPSSKLPDTATFKIKITNDVKDIAGNVLSEQWIQNNGFTVSSYYLPDTGQTQNYSSTSGEDSDYSINPPSLVNNGDGTTTDNNTELIWQTDNASTTYNWENADNYCSELNLANITDWRLPEVQELVTVFNYSYSNNFIDITYYSSTPSVSDSGLAWRILSTGSTDDYHITNRHGVKCVSGPNNDDVLVKDDSVVYSQKTSLYWQTEDDGTKRYWEDALTYCEQLNLKNYTDWRLPNIKELFSITNLYKSNAMDASFVRSGAIYWSSTLQNSTTAKTIQYPRGTLQSGSIDNNVYYARCVRGGN
jgi:hypothetical protein